MRRGGTIILRQPLPAHTGGRGAAAQPDEPRGRSGFAAMQEEGTAGSLAPAVLRLRRDAAEKHDNAGSLGGANRSSRKIGKAFDARSIAVLMFSCGRARCFHDAAVGSRARAGGSWPQRSVARASVCIQRAIATQHAALRDRAKPFVCTSASDDEIRIPRVVLIPATRCLPCPQSDDRAMPAHALVLRLRTRFLLLLG